MNRQHLLPMLLLAALWGPALPATAASEHSRQQTEASGTETVRPAAPDMEGRVVRGTVSSKDGEPVIGAGVLIQGTSIGTLTGEDGGFTLTIPQKYNNGSLLFSAVGYEEAVLPLRDRKRFTVVLQDNLRLDEVIVIGYGSQKKEFVLGSVSQVTSKELIKAPASNVNNMIAGKLSGVTARQFSGEPGADASGILIRGLATYKGAGPLYIIDGMESGSMSYLNPNDIESISILKDAATAAIYGVKGGNGVILVTTKSGSRSSHATISYDGSTTLTQNTRMAELLDAEGYIYWDNKARELDGEEPRWTQERISRLMEDGMYGDTDYLSLIFKKFGTMSQHNVSASGGTEKFKYYSSIGYMDQRGILRRSDFQRYNIRANIDATLAKGLKYNINLSGRHSKKSACILRPEVQAWANPITTAFNALPFLINEYEGLPLGNTYGGGVGNTPDAQLNLSGTTTSWNYEFNSRMGLEYDFTGIDALKGLKIGVFGGYDFNMALTRNFSRNYEIWCYDLKTGDLTKTNCPEFNTKVFGKGTSMSWRYNLRPQISYDRTFGRHTVSALALFEKTKYYNDNIWASVKNFVADAPLDIDRGIEVIGRPSGNYNFAGDVGFAGRVNYSYDGRYIAEFSFREAATYIFAPEKRWGFFPSLSLGWTLSKEDFFKDRVSWVDHLKLRASIGQMGSNDCSPYLYLRNYRATYPGFVAGFGGRPVGAFYTSGYVHKDLTWSHMTSYNAGFEARLLKNKLSLEFDWFYKYTDRILDAAGGNIYPPSLGGNHPSWTNSGKMDDRGFELTVQHDNWLSNGFNYSVRGMVSWARNKLLWRTLADDHPSYRKQLGEPIGQCYGFKYAGLFQSQEEVDNAPAAPSGHKGVGEIKFVDVNGDGKLTRDQDYVKLGRPSLPELNYSLNLEMSWKGVGLSALFYGVAICDYRISGLYNNGHTDGTLYTRPFYGAGNTFKYVVERAWTPDHTQTKYPRLHAGNNYNSNNDNFNDLWVVNGAYFRLKDLHLSYTLPSRAARMIGLSRAQIYLAGNNLFTLTEFKYLDPESPGLNNGYYPQQKTYSLGLNLTF